MDAMQTGKRKGSSMESKEAQTAVEPLGDASEDDGGKRVSRRARIGIAIGCAALLMAVLIAACSLCSPGPGETADEVETESGQSVSGSSEEEAPGDEEAEPPVDEEAEAASDTDTEPASTAAARAASDASGGARPAASQPASEPEQPAHQHSWEPVYTTVVDQAAYTTTEVVDTYLQCSCGATFNTVEEWITHSKAAGRGSQHSYSSVPKYGQVNHPEISHQEISGYRCSSCGATK